MTLRYERWGFRIHLEATVIRGGTTTTGRLQGRARAVLPRTGQEFPKIWENHFRRGGGGWRRGRWKIGGVRGEKWNLK